MRTEKQADGTTKTVTEANPGSALAWVYGGVEDRKWAVRDFKFGRTLSTACVVDGLLYIGELPGYVHCFDARTGKHFWQYDTKASIWGSCYYADGKVFVGTESGELFVWTHTKTPRTIDDLDPAAANEREAKLFRRARHKEVADTYLLAKIEFDAPIRATPCVAGGVLYVATERTLYAVGKR